MNTMKEKKAYEAPQLTVVTFKAEAGYATSLTFLLALSSIAAALEQSSQSLESRENGGSWGGSDSWY